MTKEAIRRAVERTARQAGKQPLAPTADIDTYDPNEMLEELPPLAPELAAIVERHYPGEAAERERMNEITRDLNRLKLQGREVSARNAVKHGSCSIATLILSNESLLDFEALEKRWFAAYNPQSDFEAELIRTAVRADWFYLRSDRNYAEAEAQIMTEEPNLLKWTEEHHKALARFQRYRTTNNNVLAKHRKALEDFRKNRTAEAVKVEKLEMLRDRNEAREEKELNEGPLENRLEYYRQLAVRLGLKTPADAA